MKRIRNAYGKGSSVQRRLFEQQFLVHLRAEDSTRPGELGVDTELGQRAWNDFFQDLL
jgi:hypothetical protein